MVRVLAKKRVRDLLEEIASNLDSPRDFKKKKPPGEGGRITSEFRVAVWQSERRLKTKREESSSASSTSKKKKRERAEEENTEMCKLWNSKSKKKLLVLDVNGLLADIVADYRSAHKPDKVVSRKGVYKRPFCDDFLTFCFEKFNVGIWSSRTKKNLNPVLDCLMKNDQDKLLFCWDQSHCTNIGVKTAENKYKPLLLKELKKLWDTTKNKLAWEKGFYDETNTILLDDSPDKAMYNPLYTGVFPFPYSFRDTADKSLGKDGDLRLYLERLADAENVKSFIQKNLFGQKPITKK